jgi:c-di-GMP phosphodiesterase
MSSATPTANVEPQSESSLSLIRQSLVGRQPILDREGNVRAYELLFRLEVNAAALPFDGNRATATVIINALTEFDLDQLVGPHRAYINFTGDLLQDDTALLLPKDRIVIEILEDVIVNDELIEAAKGLTRQGYQLALDDFVYDPQWDPLLDLASIVKIDDLALDAACIAEQVERLRRYKVKLVAEKVETAQEHTTLLELGFDLCQGYYYAKPNIVARDKIPENHVAAVGLLATLYDDSATQQDIEALVTEDVALSY